MRLIARRELREFLRGDRAVIGNWIERETLDAIAGAYRAGFEDGARSRGSAEQEGRMPMETASIARPSAVRVASVTNVEMARYLSHHSARVTEAAMWFLDDRLADGPNDHARVEMVRLAVDVLAGAADHLARQHVPGANESIAVAGAAVAAMMAERDAALAREAFLREANEKLSADLGAALEDLANAAGRREGAERDTAQLRMALGAALFRLDELVKEAELLASPIFKAAGDAPSGMRATGVLLECNVSRGLRDKLRGQGVDVDHEAVRGGRNAEIIDTAGKGKA